MRKTAPRNKRSTPLLPLLPRFFFSFLFSFRFLLFSSSFHSDVTFIVSIRTNFNDGILSISRWFSEIAEETFLSIFLKIFPRISFPIDSQLIEKEKGEEEEEEAIVGNIAYILIVELSRNETLPERNWRGYWNPRRWNSVHDLMLSPLGARAPDRGNYRGWDPLSLKSCAHYVLKISRSTGIGGFGQQRVRKHPLLEISESFRAEVWREVYTRQVLKGRFTFQR